MAGAVLGRGLQIKEHSGDTPLGAAAEALGKALRADLNATADLRAEIDSVWAEAKNAKVTPAPPAGAKPGPTAAVPLFSAPQLRALPKVLSGGFSLGNLREEDRAGAEVQAFPRRSERDARGAGALHGERDRGDNQVHAVRRWRR